MYIWIHVNLHINVELFFALYAVLAAVEDMESNRFLLLLDL